MPNDDVVMKAILNMAFRLLTKSILFLNLSLKSNDSRAEEACLVNKSCELRRAQGRALGEQKIDAPRPNRFLT